MSEDFHERYAHLSRRQLKAERKRVKAELRAAQEKRERLTAAIDEHERLLGLLETGAVAEGGTRPNLERLDLERQP